jgi:hypothetical protein
MKKGGGLMSHRLRSNLMIRNNPYLQNQTGPKATHPRERQLYGRAL